MREEEFGGGVGVFGTVVRGGGRGVGGDGVTLFLCSVNEVPMEG